MGWSLGTGQFAARLVGIGWVQNLEKGPALCCHRLFRPFPLSLPPPFSSLRRSFFAVFVPFLCPFAVRLSVFSWALISCGHRILTIANANRVLEVKLSAPTIFLLLDSAASVDRFLPPFVFILNCKTLPLNLLEASLAHAHPLVQSSCSACPITQSLLRFQPTSNASFYCPFFC